MDKKFYAGIGSRNAPQDIRDQVAGIALSLNNWGYTLISGGADGMDRAFEIGAINNSLILRAGDCTPEARIISAMFHPAWHNCKEYARNLLGRNSMIILNKDLQTPVDFVLCWTSNEEYGGTSLGIKIARSYNIPVFNFYKCTTDDFLHWFRSNYIRETRYKR